MELQKKRRIAQIFGVPLEQGGLKFWGLITDGHVNFPSSLVKIG